MTKLLVKLSGLVRSVIKLTKGHGGMNRLQICMFDSVFFLQVQILLIDVKVENVQLQISTSSNLKLNDFY